MVFVEKLLYVVVVLAGVVLALLGSKYIDRLDIDRETRWNDFKSRCQKQYRDVTMYSTNTRGNECEVNGIVVMREPR